MLSLLKLVPPKLMLPLQRLLLVLLGTVLLRLPPQKLLKLLMIEVKPFGLKLSGLTALLVQLLQTNLCENLNEIEELTVEIKISQLDKI